MERMTGTRRQEQALAFIKGYTERNGLAPLYVEIRDAMGLASTSSVHRILRGLEDRGLITRRQGCNRSIAIVPTIKAAILQVLNEVPLSPVAEAELRRHIRE